MIIWIDSYLEQAIDNEKCEGEAEEVGEVSKVKEPVSIRRTRN